MAARSAVFTSDEGATSTTVNQLQRRHAGVAEPSDPASRLIADVQLGDGFPLELGVAATDREPTGVVIFVHP